MRQQVSNNLRIILIGVSGSGKTTIGKLFSKYFKFKFIEGDNYHPMSSKIKMQKGVPLNRSDRVIWHIKIQKKLDLHRSWVLSCSALGKWQRKILFKKNKSLFFIHCKCDETILAKRLGMRTGHFFPASLLSSQLCSFENPRDIPVLKTSLSKSQCLRKIFLITENQNQSFSNYRSDLSRL